MARTLPRRSLIRPENPHCAAAGECCTAASDQRFSTLRKEEYGSQLAELSSGTLGKLDEFLPAHWSHGNPIDVLGDAGAERFSQAIAIARDDPNTDGVLAILPPPGITAAQDFAH